MKSNEQKWLDELKSKCDKQHPGLYESQTEQQWLEMYYNFGESPQFAINEAMRTD